MMKRIGSGMGGRPRVNASPPKDKSQFKIQNLKNSKSIANKYFAISQETRLKKNQQLDDYNELDDMINNYLSAKRDVLQDASSQANRASKNQIILTSCFKVGLNYSRKSSIGDEGRKFLNPKQRTTPAIVIKDDDDDDDDGVQTAVGEKGDRLFIHGRVPVIQEAISDNEELSEASNSSFKKEKVKQRNKEIYQSLIDRADFTISKRKETRLTRDSSPRQFHKLFDEDDQREATQQFNQNKHTSVLQESQSHLTTDANMTTVSTVTAIKGVDSTTPSYAMGTFVSKKKEKSGNTSRKVITARPGTAVKSSQSGIISSLWSSAIRPQLSPNKWTEAIVEHRLPFSRQENETEENFISQSPLSSEEITPIIDQDKDTFVKDCEDIVSKIRFRGRIDRTPQARPTTSGVKRLSGRLYSHRVESELGGGDDDDSMQDIFHGKANNLATENDLQKLANLLFEKQFRKEVQVPSDRSHYTKQGRGGGEFIKASEVKQFRRLSDKSLANNLLSEAKTSHKEIDDNIKDATLRNTKEESARSFGIIRKSSTATILTTVGQALGVHLGLEKEKKLEFQAAAAKISAAIQKFTGPSSNVILARPESKRLSSTSNDFYKYNQKTKDEQREISANPTDVIFKDAEAKRNPPGSFNRTVRPQTSAATQKLNSSDLGGMALSKDIQTSTTKLMERYEVKCTIGKGSYAIVKLARDTQTDKNVAIKLYDKHKLMDQQKRNNVKREIAILNKLNHNNIIKLFTTIDTRSTINLVMEYISSTSLRQFMKELEGKQLEEKYARCIFRQLVSAVGYCHDYDVIHRDIKLENIMVETGNNITIKLIDFGFAIRVASDKKLSIFCGTPSYMSPEITKKKDYFGKPADIWSIGIVLYALINGRFPFKGKDDNELFKMIQSGEFKFSPCSSTVAQKLILRILQLNPEDRPTAKEILADRWLSD